MTFRLWPLYEQNGQQMQAIATWNNMRVETGINEQVSTEKVRLIWD